MALIQVRFWLGTLAVSLACSAMAGGLGELKKKTDEKAEDSPPKKSQGSKAYSNDSAATSSFGSGTYPASGNGSGFMSDFVGWLVAVPFSYRAEDPASSMSSDQEGWAEGGSGGMLLPGHQTGQPVMPYIRADLNGQYIDQDNTAMDGRVELGYKAIGFQARSTKYEDSLLDYTQRISQYYGMLRFGGRWPNAFPGTFEVAFGLGAARQSGDLSDDSSVALTFPLKYQPVDWLGVEFRPAWYKADYGGLEYRIGDYDLSASLGMRFVQFRAGYRWLWFNSIGRTLDGPYAGISLSY